MKTLPEIEAAIAQLSREEFAEFERWFYEELNRRWDQDMEQDAKAGRLDALLAEADKERAEGRTRPLDELCGGEKS